MFAVFSAWAGLAAALISGGVSASRSAAAAAVFVAVVVAGGFFGGEAFGVQGGEFGVVVVVAAVDGDFLFDEFFDVVQEFVFFRRAEGDGEAGGSGASGAPDAVDVGFGFVREVVVDDEGDVFHVDAACGDVGRDEDGEVAFAEFIEGFIALFLAAVAVDGFGNDVVLFQVAAEFVRAVFGAGKDDGEFPGGEGFELVDEEGAFVFLGYEADLLVHFFGGGRFGGDGDGGGILEDGVGQLADGGGEGGGEKEGLPFLREHGHDFFDVAQEAHVQHAVNFIEDEKFHAREVEVAFVDKVEEAAGTGHEDVDALAHGFDLRTFADAAVDEGVAEAQVLPVGLEAFADLGGEFPRGGEDEDAGGFAARAGGIFVQGVQDGEGKGGRFSGAGLGAAEEIAPGEEGRDGLGLDRGGGAVVLLRKCLL